ncbi:MAG: endonuclease [Bacteroidia bacterium]|nr:endonuclease [Bacteroidia bacterium]
MLRKTLLICSMIPGLMAAQPLLAPAVLPFGTVLETAPASLPLTVRNPGPDSLCADTRIYAIETQYSSLSPFSVTPADFCLAPGDSITLTVQCSPAHNLQHHSELVLHTDRGRGSAHVHLSAQGRYSNPYYSSTENLSEEALKTALRARLAQGFISLSYNASRDELFMEVDNERINGQGAAVNTLTCIYTGTVITGYADRTAAQNLGFNTEHVFPQGFFNQDLPMRSDMYHLYPVLESANSARGNLPFGVVGTPDWQSGGSKRGGGVFEPRNDAKGDIARCMLYFVIRYQDYQQFLQLQESVLRAWHLQYLPDAAEIARNQAISVRQGNRNPFIDYPQLAGRIRVFSGLSAAQSVYRIQTPDSLIQLGTVRAGDRYTAVLVNTGNQPIRIYGAEVSDGAAAADPAPDTVLQPGYALAVSLTWQRRTAGAWSGTLSLLTDAPGLAQLAFPMQGEVLSPQALDPAAAGFRIYPNPARETLWVAAPAETGRWSAELLDVQGRRVSRTAVYSGGSQARLDLAGLPPGAYLLRIRTRGRSYQQAVSVQR